MVFMVHHKQLQKMKMKHVLSTGILKKSGASSHGFLLSRYIARPAAIYSGAIKFVPVQSSQRKLSLFILKSFNIIFPKYCMQFKVITKVSFFYFSLHRSFESKNFRFLFLYEKPDLGT